MRDPPIEASDRIFEANGVVFRPAGSWSTSVQELLQHLEAVGFSGSPRFLGTDGDGREKLTFIDGEVGHYPLPISCWSDVALQEAARLLRRYHDATVGFSATKDAHWKSTPPGDLPIEVVCHNDFAPYNCVYRANLPFGMIDFDLAAPGSRGWDLAYTTYRFVPLSSPDNRAQFGFPAGASIERRLGSALDAYDYEGRDEFVELIERRVVTLRELTDVMAGGHDANAERIRRERHVESYDRDLVWLKSNKSRLQKAINAL